MISKVVVSLAAGLWLLGTSHAFPQPLSKRDNSLFGSSGKPSLDDFKGDKMRNAFYPYLYSIVNSNADFVKDHIKKKEGTVASFDLWSMDGTVYPTDVDGGKQEYGSPWWFAGLVDAVALQRFRPQDQKKIDPKNMGEWLTMFTGKEAEAFKATGETGSILDTLSEVKKTDFKEKIKDAGGVPIVFETKWKGCKKLPNDIYFTVKSVDTGNNKARLWYIDFAADPTRVVEDDYSIDEIYDDLSQLARLKKKLT